MMARYNISFVVSALVETEVTAKSRAEAEERASKLANKIFPLKDWEYLDGSVMHCGTTNLDVLDTLSD